MRRTILTEAEQLLTQVVYLNKLCSELHRRSVQADALAAAYERKFSEGDINRLEVNKVNLMLRWRRRLCKRLRPSATR